MNSTKNTARLAGLLWVLVGVTTGFSLGYVRTKLIVSLDAAATVSNIIASESLFRAAIASSILSQIFLLFFGLTIFRLFKGANKTLATIFLSSLLVGVAIGVVNSLNNLGALLVLSNPDNLKAFQPDQINALAMIFLRQANGSGQGLLEIFWTPYYFSWGLLIVKSKYLPGILGVLLMMMSVGYAINILDKFLIPQFHPVAFTRLAMTLGAIGGIPTILWLLIKGANVRAVEDQSRSAL